MNCLKCKNQWTLFVIIGFYEETKKYYECLKCGLTKFIGMEKENG